MPSVLTLQRLDSVDASSGRQRCRGIRDERYMMLRWQCISTISSARSALQRTCIRSSLGRLSNGCRITAISPVGVVGQCPFIAARSNATLTPRQAAAVEDEALQSLKRIKDPILYDRDKTTEDIVRLQWIKVRW